ncbi:LysR family transcriptional regulator [Caballeronia terrestris]|uniref:LysR family transcriptional regulator n=1 Tax=Caballeronia terrestris TaxID=1226301 RepID=A0A158KUN4_9BURK|nr:LysR family transcriptional regulator [Caballeronia terrestris]
MWLLPRLASFHEANDDIELNLACSYEDVSFTSGYYDVDIRHGYARWTDGEVETLRNEFMAPLASQDYLKRFPVCKPEDLLERPDFSETPLVQWQQWFGKFGVAVRRRTIFLSIARTCPLRPQRWEQGIALESTMLASVHLGQVPWYQYLTVHSPLKWVPTIWFTRPKTPICHVSRNF